MNTEEMEIYSEEMEIYWDLFCGGKRPRVLNTNDARPDYSGNRCRVMSADEWNRMQQEMTDEEKAMLAYER